LDANFFFTVTLPSCGILTSGSEQGRYWITNLIAKVRSLSHIAEQTDFYNTCEHLDLCQEL